MSYREENGQVVLTMSRDDWDRLLMMFGALMMHEKLNPGKTPLSWEAMLEFVNRLNQGNPNYTPYQVEESCPTNEGRS